MPTKQTLEHRLKRTAEVMRGCGPECDIDSCHIIAVDEAAARMKVLEEDNAGWREIMKDELAETFKLIEALGVEKEIESGTASMVAMIGKIKQMRDDLKTLASEVRIARRAEKSCAKARFEMCDPTGRAASDSESYRAAQHATDTRKALERNP